MVTYCQGVTEPRYESIPSYPVLRLNHKVAEGLRGKRKDRGIAPVFSDMSGNTIRDDS